MRVRRVSSPAEGVVDEGAMEEVRLARVGNCIRWGRGTFWRKRSHVVRVLDVICLASDCASDTSCVNCDFDVAFAVAIGIVCKALPPSWGDSSPFEYVELSQSKVVVENEEMGESDRSPGYGCGMLACSVIMPLDSSPSLRSPVSSLITSDFALREPVTEDLYAPERRRIDPCGYDDDGA
ncbi:hypothetical protein BC834DRAFT_877947 [Gloeopeniophorella convolvens]|nr:hypothetical protein BC834DRAFT_877947 [Gloeopeniophorella convolvens]